MTKWILSLAPRTGTRRRTRASLPHRVQYFQPTGLSLSSPRHLHLYITISLICQRPLHRLLTPPRRTSRRYALQRGICPFRHWLSARWVIASRHSRLRPVKGFNIQILPACSVLKRKRTPGRAIVHRIAPFRMCLTDALRSLVGCYLQLCSSGWSRKQQPRIGRDWIDSRLRRLGPKR